MERGGGGGSCLQQLAGTLDQRPRPGIVLTYVWPRAHTHAHTHAQQHLHFARVRRGDRAGQGRSDLYVRQERAVLTEAVKCVDHIMTAVAQRKGASLLSHTHRQRQGTLFACAQSLILRYRGGGYTARLRQNPPSTGTSPVHSSRRTRAPSHRESE
jgi:hypothetical protein